MSRKLAKILSAVLLITAFAVGMIPVPEAEATGVLTSDFETEGNKLLRYTGTAEVVSVPDEIKVIGEEAFAGNDSVVAVDIGGQTKEIGYRAFADCDNLRTVTIGDSVEKIDSAAFSNDRSLMNVSIGSGVKTLGSGVFAGSSNLDTLTLHEDNPYLLYSNGVLYDNEQSILYTLLPGYEKGAVTFPESVKEISAYAFWGNPYLERVKLDSNLINISAYAFSNCMNLKEVYIPLPVHTIEAKAFENCVNLKQVTLPDSINNIHSTAFDGCSNVEFTATPGTYAGKFAAERKASDADQTEYEDTTEGTVISSDEILQDTDSKADENGSEEDEDHSADDQEQTEQENGVPVQPKSVGGSYSSARLLGETSIVAGRAVVFIDNQSSAGTTENGYSLDLNREDMNTEGLTSELKVYDILSENAEKGKDFPKYTVVGDKIASEAYYQNKELTEYEIEDSISKIGDFAFARSNLSNIVIPSGVKKIGYASFYHCDHLTDVEIPASVEEIGANAFQNTPWLTNAMNSSGAYPFLVVGDGILLAYAGNESVINIPAGVKQIGAECFKGHMGITAVNIPDTVEIIGESAFLDCKNLKTVNGGNQLRMVKDRAFQNCPLSEIRIPSTMEEIGIAAYDCLGGTDTVTFEGEFLPKLLPSSSSERLSNTEARTYAFAECKTAIIRDQNVQLSDSVLEDGVYGFRGNIYYENGQQAAVNHGVTQMEESGITVQINSSSLKKLSKNVMATMPGNEGSYLLTVTDSESAGEKIRSAYGELYGGRTPSGLKAFEITLYEAGGQIPITKLGKQYVTVQIPMPEGGIEDGMHVVTLDQDGQLEAVEHQRVELEDGTYIQFTARHFSPYGIYQSDGYSGQGIVQNGKSMIGLSGKKDDTPDTGDNIHPKWFLVMGLLAGSIALFFYKKKSKA